MKWISVEEKRPEIGEDVLTWDGCARSIGHVMDDKEFYDFTTCDINVNVSHWMPLPDPPID